MSPGVNSQDVEGPGVNSGGVDSQDSEGPGVNSEGVDSKILKVLELTLRELTQRFLKIVSRFAGENI